MKKNNKGFSLVELIVVVLIMAIIAVALAPQVMKWVENSRKSTDCNNYDSVVSAVNIALADETVMGNLGTTGYTLTWTAAVNGTWTVTGDTSKDNGASLKTKIAGILGTNWDQDLKVKRTTDFVDQNNATGNWEIKVDTNGTVSRTKAPSSKGIS